MSKAQDKAARDALEAWRGDVSYEQIAAWAGTSVGTIHNWFREGGRQVKIQHAMRLEKKHPGFLRAVGMAS